MKKLLLILLCLPFISFTQTCDTVTNGIQYADTIIYCVTDASCHDLCDGGITIQVIGSNHPYSYSWSNGATFVPGDNSRDSLCANQYIISIQDGNGNLVNNTYVNNLISPPNFTLYPDSVKNPTCFNYTDGKIYLSIGGATPPYNYSWEDGTSTDDRDNLDSGLYVLTTVDFNGCERKDTFELNYPDKVNSITITDTLSCIGLCDATGIVTPSNGVAPYTYQWSNGDTDSITVTGLCYGIDTVYITDANGCLDTNWVDIANPDTLQLSSITIDSSCYQICDGELSVTIEGGTSPYDIEWSLGGNVFDTINTTTDDSLCPGNYQIKFTDANDCVDSVIIPLIERDSFIIQDWIIDDSCYNSCTGQITVQLINQDNPPFIYDWSNGGNDTVISNLCSDTFELVIIDARLCRDTFDYFFVAPGDSMYFDSVSVTHNSCYGDEDGAISLINFNGGIQPLYYLWSDGQTTSGINSLASGLYNVTITDANGCSIDSSNIEISQPDSLFATPSLENVNCFGAADGLIDIDIFGGIEPYFISWNNTIPDSILIDTVPAGEYIYTIIDSNSCTLSDTLIVEEPDQLVMSDSIIDVLCKGENTGEIHITVTGGIPPYGYSINGGTNFQPQAYFDNLSAGSYSIIVKDANDCLLNSALYNISEPLTVLSAGLISPNLLCFGDTGTVVLNVSGGTAPYTYSWSNGITTQDLNGIGAGNYSVTILDANGCELIKDTIVTEPDEIISSPLPVITDLSCFEDGTGSIDMSIIGGISPYDYDWNNGDTTSDISNLSAGTYVITVTDDNGCNYIESFIVEQPALLEATYVPTHVDCYEASTGGIDVTVSGGTLQYSYDWYPNLISTQDLSNIPAGVYILTITDGNACDTFISVNINEPSKIIYLVSTIDLVCEGINEGQISIATISGGTPAYEYSIDGATYQSSSQPFDNLSAGNYTVRIIDQNGCYQDTLVILDEPIGYSSDVDIQHVEDCSGDATGSIEFTINGNTPPYTYSWSNGESTASIYDLTAGDYDVIVNDLNNCEMVYSYSVIEPYALELEYTIQPASCEEKNDGAITTLVTGGTPPYSYQWGTGESTADISNLSKGTYSLYIEDSKGCNLPTKLIEVGFDGYNGCIEIPTGFTPNNDNIHDEWEIYGLIDFPDVIVSVYNRWGQEVFSSKGNYIPWDGKHNGVDLPTATYYYLIELNESEKVFNGTVTIKR